MCVDLEIVPTIELAEELFNRCDSGAIVLMADRDDPNSQKRRSDVSPLWNGDPLVVLGLLQYLSQEITSQMCQMEERMEPGPDKPEPKNGERA